MIYRKKVQTVIAMQFLGEKSLVDVGHFLGNRCQYFEWIKDKGLLIVYNRRDIVTIKVGDYLAKGADFDSFYGYSKDLFEDNYEVDE